MIVPHHGSPDLRTTALLLTVFALAGLGRLRAEGPPALPDPVAAKVAEFKTRAARAAIVRTGDGPWLVATESGAASDRMPAVMERDSASRAAIVAAKRRIAELLAAEISTYLTAAADDRGRGHVAREVTVAVIGQALARVQLLDERYEPDRKRCHVVIAIAPLDKAVGHEIEFPDAEVAARHFLDRCSHRLASPGVICARLAGSTDRAPRLVFIAIALGPMAPDGRRTVADAKAQALLVRFWGETLESRVQLEQGRMADPDDPQGSQLLHYEHLEKWAKSRSSAILPPFQSIGLDRDGISFVAIWCTN